MLVMTSIMKVNMSKAFVDQVLKILGQRSFHVDGFRFDLSKGFTQKASTEATAGNYDASRISILKRIADKVWEYNDDAYIIMEHFADNAEEKETGRIWHDVVGKISTTPTMKRPWVFTANGNSDIRNMGL
jgi:hypothetical protein